MSSKISVAVVYGGHSGEHEVSIISASSVIKHLDRTKYDITPIGIDKEGHWHRNELNEVDPLNNKPLLVQGPESVPFAMDHFFLKDREFDVVFPVLHGTYGEDGCIQGFFELAQIPYVGSGVLGSALGMDKEVTKRLALQAGIKIAPYYYFNLGKWQLSQAKVLADIQQTLPYPLFVKPANTGSSVGISKVKKEEDLIPAIEYALLYDNSILIEHGLNIREVEIAALESPVYGELPLVSLPGEIITTHEFYDYNAKYLDEKGLQLIIPAKLASEKVQELQALAKKIFTLLNCEGMARIDFFIDKDTGEIIFNELNTIPGFTHVSMYPMMWQASDKPYPELLDNLLTLAIARQARKNKLKRDFS